MNELHTFITNYRRATSAAHALGNSGGWAAGSHTLSNSVLAINYYV